jgi:acetyl esterase/lipase
MHKLSAALLASFLICRAIAEEKVIRLYEGPAPGTENWKHKEKESRTNLWQTRLAFNVADPTLTIMLPPTSEAVGTAVVVCPGGAFHALSIDTEGLDVGRWLNKKGVAAFVLKYRLVECETDDPATEVMGKGPRFVEDVLPIVRLAGADGRAAVAHVRQHAREYNVNPDRIGILGFSAGGTVAASVAFHHDAASKPNFAAPIYLAYEFLGKKKVPDDAPPMFILAATDDQLGLAPQSVALYMDWAAAKKPAELHLYQQGGHGFGMRKQNLPADQWIERFGDWLAAQGVLKK